MLLTKKIHLTKCQKRKQMVQVILGKGMQSQQGTVRVIVPNKVEIKAESIKK